MALVVITFLLEEDEIIYQIAENTEPRWQRATRSRECSRSLESAPITGSQEETHSDYVEVYPHRHTLNSDIKKCEKIFPLGGN